MLGKLTTIALALLLAASACSAQIMGIGNRKIMLVGGTNTWSLHSGVVCSNEAGGTSVSCVLTGVSAGDLITVQAGDRDCALSKVTDSSNSGNYSQVYLNKADADDPNCTSQMYFSNSASGTLTVTATASSSDLWMHISAQAWIDSGGGSAPSLDSTFSSPTTPFFDTSSSSTNANCGTAKTPSNPNELIISYAEGDGGTYTHGTGYTALGTNESENPSGAQYWIQTTPTSTNGAFSSTLDDWGAGCAAFKP
jgi:hypothetical protein